MHSSNVSTHGMAVAPHHLASQSALAILREGGSAIEAMVAAAAAVCSALTSGAAEAQPVRAVHTAIDPAHAANIWLCFINASLQFVTGGGNPPAGDV